MAGLFFSFFFSLRAPRWYFQLNVVFQQLWIPANACFPLSIKLTMIFYFKAIPSLRNLTIFIDICHIDVRKKMIPIKGSIFFICSDRSAKHLL